MAKNFTQNFIDLSNRGFSSNRSPELGLYHGEGGFDIRPLMVMAQEYRTGLFLLRLAIYVQH